MNNTALENAKALVNTLTGKEVAEMRAIKEAYEQLPKAYATEFKKRLENILKPEIESESLPRIKVEPDDYYTQYVNIWQQSTDKCPDISWRWLSVGFYHDEVRFYLVCNRKDEDENKKYAESKGFTYSSYSRGDYWYKKDSNDFSIKTSADDNNDLLIDFDKIINHCIDYLNILGIVNIKEI